MFCSYCQQQINEGFICGLCSRRFVISQLPDVRLNFKSQTNIETIYCPYIYEDSIQELIHRAKIKDDFVATNLILALVEQYFTKNPLDVRWQKICPTPSSLWGRMRGRTDIAYLIADFISQNFRIPLVRAPFETHWKIKKSARVKKIRRKSGLLQGIFINCEKSQLTSASPLLIVDDVLTTGQTVGNILNNMNTKADVFVFAVSPRIYNKRYEKKF